MTNLELLSRAFFHFDHWLGAQPIGSGHINDTYRIDFEENGAAQTYVLQRLNHEVFQQPEALMDNISRVTHYLAAQPDYPLAALAPLPTHSGHSFQRDPAGNYWRVFPMLENTFAPETIASPAEAREAAQAYGAFARALRHFPAHTLAETIPGFHDTDRRWRVFEKILAQNPTERLFSAQPEKAMTTATMTNDAMTTADRLFSAQPEIAAMRRAKRVFDQISHLKTSGTLPLRVTHNDTKAGNVLLDSVSGRAVAVIDLDTVMPGTLLSDFGDMVRTFVPDRYEDDPDIERLTLRTEILGALTEGFLSETADFLSDAEREHLLLGASWIVGEQALRFLTDYLAGDPYYKTRYPQHNLVRARNQLQVFSRLEAMRDTHLPLEDL